MFHMVLIWSQLFHLVYFIKWQKPSSTLSSIFVKLAVSHGIDVD